MQDSPDKTFLAAALGASLCQFTSSEDRPRVVRNPAQGKSRAVANAKHRNRRREKLARKSRQRNRRK